MQLSENSLRWAIEHLKKFGDTDLFPIPIEFDILYNSKEDVLKELKNIDLGNYEFGSARRFVVPKDDISFRTATQLDPIDSIFLSAMIYEYGANIEKVRVDINEARVFSYRFNPQKNYALFNPKVSWIDFWKECKIKSKNYSYAVQLDIADFYNQIYHHSVENQLIKINLPNQVIKWFLNLFGNITAQVSRGIPVGSHATHLIAELVMSEIDDSMLLKGFDFCRYVDDIVIFCNSEDEARIIIYKMAELLDKQQRLMLQRQKTKIYDNMAVFREHCENMIKDQPINKDEEIILNVIQKRSLGRSPYEHISIDDLNDDELKKFNTTTIEAIFSDYLKSSNPNYIRLRWFLRRLSQVGVATGVDYCIINLKLMIPVLNDTCAYLISASDNYVGNWKGIGQTVIQNLNSEIIKSSEYFQLSLLSLFSKNVDLNHIVILIGMYENANPILRRKIILAGYKNNASTWIHELKEQYITMDIWSKRSFIIACSCLPKDEKKFFLNNIKDNDVLSRILIKWSKK